VPPDRTTRATGRAGGGLEAGEEPLAALRRELWEELGQQVADLAGPVASEHVEFAFDGSWLVVDSVFSWARVPAAFAPRPRLLTELEQRFLLGWRWFTAAELAAPRDEAVYPADLAGIVAGLPAA
jgi:8-oxo-dGTP pyrophosphatase MutT (NUDIX family)